MDAQDASKASPPHARSSMNIRTTLIANLVFAAVVALGASAARAQSGEGLHGPAHRPVIEVDGGGKYTALVMSLHRTTLDGVPAWEQQWDHKKGRDEIRWRVQVTGCEVGAYRVTGDGGGSAFGRTRLIGPAAE
jgi:hypothetical protein